MNRDAIRKTAVCSFNKKEKVYVVESPLLEICHGISKNQKEARRIFSEILDEMYIEYLEGRRVGQYKKPGRPAKKAEEVHVRVKPQTKTTVIALAKYLGATQGEALDYLATLWVSESMSKTKTM